MMFFKDEKILPIHIFLSTSRWNNRTSRWKSFNWLSFGFRKYPFLFSKFRKPKLGVSHEIVCNIQTKILQYPSFPFLDMHFVFTIFPSLLTIKFKLTNLCQPTTSYFFNINIVDNLIINPISKDTFPISSCLSNLVADITWNEFYLSN